MLISVRGQGILITREWKKDEKRWLRLVLWTLYIKLYSVLSSNSGLSQK